MKGLTMQSILFIVKPSGYRHPQTDTHHQVVDALVEILGFRDIGVGTMEFAVSRDRNKMFELTELDQAFNGARFALGIRNSHGKTMRATMTVGCRLS